VGWPEAFYSNWINYLELGVVSVYVCVWLCVCGREDVEVCGWSVRR